MNTQRHTKKSPQQTGKPRKLNVRLLRRIQRHILEEPRRFFMWGIHIEKFGNSEGFDSDNGTWQEFPPCGTVACIAGWANLLTGHRANNFKAARKSLGIDDSDGFSFLFDLSGWPEPFYSRYDNAKRPATRAKIACARIDHLIKTGE